MPKKTARNKTADEIRQSIKLKHLEAKKSFHEKYPQASEFLAKRGLEVGRLREHSAKLLSAGALSGTLALSAPAVAMSLPSPTELFLTDGTDTESVSGQKIFLDTVAGILPENPRPLTREEEKRIERILETATGIPVRGTLEGEHLNTNYGYIGAEQHLKRYPGDTLSAHGDRAILKEGMAPGLGAWGYFAPSKEALSPDLAETEKWYAVVQTLYLPDWGTRTRYLYDWYKYRKVLIVDTENGNAVVASIADSGPAAWTGKSFGGSPEVMNHLGGPRYKKGKVLLFFVNDPDHSIPLGPVEYNNINLAGNPAF